MGVGGAHVRHGLRRVGSDDRRVRAGPDQRADTVVVAGGVDLEHRCVAQHPGSELRRGRPRKAERRRARRRRQLGRRRRRPIARRRPRPWQLLQRRREDPARFGLPVADAGGKENPGQRVQAECAHRVAVVVRHLGGLAQLWIRVAVGQRQAVAAGVDRRGRRRGAGIGQFRRPRLPVGVHHQFAPGHEAGAAELARLPAQARREAVRAQVGKAGNAGRRGIADARRVDLRVDLAQQPRTVADVVGARQVRADRRSRVGIDRAACREQRHDGDGQPPRHRAACSVRPRAARRSISSVMARNCSVTELRTIHVPSSGSIACTGSKRAW